MTHKVESDEYALVGREERTALWVEGGKYPECLRF